MKNLFSGLRIKIRIWNPRWFINPFYSPSLDFVHNFRLNGTQFFFDKDGVLRGQDV